jgi:hypothetical protein
VRQAAAPERAADRGAPERRVEARNVHELVSEIERRLPFVN